jgi:outer membrane protein OmpA-like peptidoglycan-associated protein
MLVSYKRGPTVMRHWIIATAAAIPLLTGLPAWAQSGPSVEQIIRSLTPTGDVTKAGTRGIRLSAPTEGGPPASPMTAPVTPTGAAAPVAARATAAPTAATTSAAAREAPAAAPTLNLTVNFATGSAELTPQAVSILDRLGTALASEQLSSYRFRIEGHTDTVGTRDYNMQLSERRAEAVVSYVRNKFGVDPGRMQSAGLGPTRPLVVTADQVDEPRNRRVQVTNIGG